MDFSHELIIPSEKFPFKIFEFEGKDGNYFRDFHWHSSIEIMVCLKGSLTLCIDDVKIPFSEDEFVLINSNEVHSISAPKRNEVLVLQIPLESFSQYYSDEDFIWFSHSPKVQDIKIVSTIKKMYEAFTQKKYGYEMNVMSKFFMLMYFLVSEYKKKRLSSEQIQANKNLKNLSRITNYIKQHYMQEISLEVLADVFSYSPTYISHMFRKYAHTTFKTFLLDIRLNHAYFDITNSNLNVGEIALKHGFSGSRAFAIAFKKTYGMLPSEFRKKIRGKLDN